MEKNLDRNEKVDQKTEQKEIKKVDVVINGEIVTLKSTEEPEYLHQLANYIDKKISEITSVNMTAVINERVRTLLIALNIADDYFKSKENSKGLDVTQKKVVKEMARMQEENTVLQKKVNNLQSELANTRKEFDEYIQTFDVKENKDDNILTLPLPEARKAAR